MACVLTGGTFPDSRKSPDGRIRSSAAAALPPAFEGCEAVVAGAGIWGCTLARRLADAGKRVLVLERRREVGGNCRCETDPETGIEIHAYGSHIFHTSDEDVWKFITRFTDFNAYRHVVLAKTRKSGIAQSSVPAEGFNLYHLPIGCTLLKEFFGRTILPSALTERERREVFDAFIRGYTSKQWGVAPEKVDPSIIARLKVRDNASTDYFDDPHQGIPGAGYNALFAKMLDHPNITVETEMTLRAEGLALYASRNPGSARAPLEFAFGAPRRSPLPVYYSGPLDALFGRAFGALPWRTLRFESETLPRADYQGNSVVNYTDADVPFTRIHEFAHYRPESDGVLRAADDDAPAAAHLPARTRTVIMREYSAAWQPGDEPYYPIDNADSRALLARYRDEVAKMNRAAEQSTGGSGVRLVAGGRLGDYRYFDMDKSVAAALSVPI